MRTSEPETPKPETPKPKTPILTQILQIKPKVLKINLPPNSLKSLKKAIDTEPSEPYSIICIHCASRFKVNASNEWKCCENCPYSYWYCPKHTHLLNAESKCKYCC